MNLPLPTTDDLWAQMNTLNSAWNLFCARCHTTHLGVNSKDEFHTRADVEWTDAGIACEASQARTELVPRERLLAQLEPGAYGRLF